MAHGGKDGHPFPVPLAVYDETIRVLRDAVTRAKLGIDDRTAAIRRLDAHARALEAGATGPDFWAFVHEERRRSPERGGRKVADERTVADQRTVADDSPPTEPRRRRRRRGQLDLPGFER